MLGTTTDNQTDLLVKSAIEKVGEIATLPEVTVKIIEIVEDPSSTASNLHTVIELYARDRPALLYDVTKALSRLGLTIASAHVTTYGERVVDVFYVKDVFGLKVSNDSKLERIRSELMGALEPGDDAQRPESGLSAAE